MRKPLVLLLFVISSALGVENQAGLPSASIEMLPPLSTRGTRSEFISFGSLNRDARATRVARVGLRLVGRATDLFALPGDSERLLDLLRDAEQDKLKSVLPDESGKIPVRWPFGLAQAQELADARRQRSFGMCGACAFKGRVGIVWIFSTRLGYAGTPGPDIMVVEPSSAVDLARCDLAATAMAQAESP